MQIFKDSRGVKYTIEAQTGRDFETLIIDADDTQIVRIERDTMTGERFIYVWDGQDEDYAEKVQFFPFKDEDEKMSKTKLETVYFAVVDTYDGLTGKPVLRNEEVILDEATYAVFKEYPEDEDVYIHWAEKYEVVRLGDYEYILVNYEDSGGNQFQDVYERFRTEPLGGIEKFVEYTESPGKSKPKDAENFLEKLLEMEDKLEELNATFRGKGRDADIRSAIDLLWDLIDFFSQEEIDEADKKAFFKRRRERQG